MYTLPINRYPLITPPSVQVSAVYPGATAEDVAAVGVAVEVFAWTTQRVHQIESEDTAVAALKFASGAIGTIEASTALWEQHRDAMRQVCKDRMMAFGQAGQASKIKPVTTREFARAYAG